MAQSSHNFWDRGCSTRSRNEACVPNELSPETALDMRKRLYGNYLQVAIYSTTAILSASERGIHKRPFASRAMFLTEELGAGIG